MLLHILCSFYFVDIKELSSSCFMSAKGKVLQTCYLVHSRGVSVPDQGRQTEGKKRRDLTLRRSEAPLSA